MAGTEWLDPWYPVSAMICSVRSRNSLQGDDTDDAVCAPKWGGGGSPPDLRKKAEQDPRWPVTAIFNSMEEWRQESMMLSRRGNRSGNS
jgi:hypothetical protein